MAQQSHLPHASVPSMASREQSDPSERDAGPWQTADRADDGDDENLLLTWMTPLILTAFVFAAVIIWFWLGM